MFGGSKNRPEKWAERKKRWNKMSSEAGRSHVTLVTTVNKV